MPAKQEKQKLLQGEYRHRRQGYASITVRLSVLARVGFSYALSTTLLRSWNLSPLVKNGTHFKLCP